MLHPNPLPFSSAADRNKTVILPVLERLWPARARVLEIASGTGQHAQHFAQCHPEWQWLPSDADADSVLSIGRRCHGMTNVAAPLRLNLLSPDENLAVPALDGIYCANLLHISPWDCCAALMTSARQWLLPSGRLAVYGPFVEEDVPLAQTNLAFDADLRARNALWGLRRMADVQDMARIAGLDFEERVRMPANNIMLIWRAPAP